MTDHWSILGAGALGCLWAASLRESGRPCTLILREQRLQEITGHTTHLEPELQLVEANRRQRFTISITDRHHITAPIQHLIVTTKAKDTQQAVHDIAPMLTDNAIILLLQNGMGSQETANSLLKKCIVWAGTTTDGAWKEPTDSAYPAQWTVHHAGHGQTWIGALSPEQPLLPSSLAKLATVKRLSIHPCDDIEQRLWLKLAINGSINGLTAIHQCRNGELLTCPERWQQVNALCEETTQLLLRLNIGGDINLQAITREVLQRTANNYSSTLQDVSNGRKTELSFINGFLLNKARQLGMNLPSHQALMEQLKQRGIQ
ncbi:MAG: 2-dehydropantoate 2-reductase [Endozoicomonadaceae bacterium]|nr:2-dehydropantoate 2-reductase [Endozoicomonadaceae bacterium]